MKNHKRKNSLSRGRKFFLYLRLCLCVAIICVAVYFKYTEAPTIEKITQAVGKELKVDEAIAVISNTERGDESTMQVFGDEVGDGAEEISPVFDENFYIGSDAEDIKKELEEREREKAAEAKQISVENLSFAMGEEELADDTEAEPFRIPPPSSCSYEEKKINFKHTTPLFGVVTSKYGYRDHPIMDDASFHTGLDVAAKSGSAIVAFADGKVIDAGRNNTYGNYVLIEHSDGIRTFYGHNSKLNVKSGQKVKLGQKIAEVGSTGLSTGPHLHFEVRDGNIRLDPALYISPERV